MSALAARMARRQRGSSATPVKPERSWNDDTHAPSLFAHADQIRTHRLQTIANKPFHQPSRARTKRNAPKPAAHRRYPLRPTSAPPQPVAAPATPVAPWVERLSTPRQTSRRLFRPTPTRQPNREHSENSPPTRDTDAPQMREYSPLRAPSPTPALRAPSPTPAATTRPKPTQLRTESGARVSQPPHNEGSSRVLSRRQSPVPWHQDPAAQGPCRRFERGATQTEPPLRPFQKQLARAAAAGVFSHIDDLAEAVIDDCVLEVIELLNAEERARRSAELDYLRAVEAERLLGVANDIRNMQGDIAARWLSPPRPSVAAASMQAPPQGHAADGPDPATGPITLTKPKADEETTIKYVAGTAPLSSETVERILHDRRVFEKSLSDWGLSTLPSTINKWVVGDLLSEEIVDMVLVEVAQEMHGVCDDYLDAVVKSELSDSHVDGANVED